MAGEKPKDHNPLATQAPSSSNKLKELKAKLEECQKQSEEYLAGWQRARADFINYKKEEVERIEEILKYAGEELILKMLSVLDSFDLAEKKLPENLKKDENVKGILQIKNQMSDFLKSQGVEEIRCLDEKFDPNFHEAAEMVEAKDNSSTGSPQKESGIVIEEIQKGYTICSRVLRPAKVRVAK